MKLLRCPINGVRAMQEFAHGGELRSQPDETQATDAQWADYVFNRSGEPGVKKEWWYHLASGTWFVAERNTKTDEVVRTYLYGTEDRSP